jgi:subtilisin family serine protease
VPAPNDAYQLTTGTSVATAHVSGVIALMLEKRPDLSPDDVRAILASTAKALPGTRPVQTGAGLINPVQAMDYEPTVPAAPVASQQPKTAAR